MIHDKKAINVEIGRRIRDYRDAIRMTREELSRRCGYSVNFITAVERGLSGLSCESIRAICLALNVSADAIIFGKPGTEFRSVSDKLALVPENKRKYVLQIINAAIECSME